MTQITSLSYWSPLTVVFEGDVWTGVLAARSGPEDVDHPDDVLPADGTLTHALAAAAAGDHVSTLQQHAVHRVVHADAAQVLIQLGGRRRF